MKKNPIDKYLKKEGATQGDLAYSIGISLQLFNFHLQRYRKTEKPWPPKLAKLIEKATNGAVNRYQLIFPKG